MVDRGSRKRVAIVLHDPADSELRIARGVVDFYLQTTDWEFASGELRPFSKLERVDLDAVDGIVGNISSLDSAQAVVAAGVAAVNTSTASEHSPLPRVAIDDPAVGRLAAEHLLERGLSHMAFVPSRTTGAWFDQRRLEGFRRVVEDVAGLRCEVYTAPSGQKASHVQAITDWLMRLPKPTGIFAAVDDQAYWLVRQALSLGLRVPDDLAVVGVDNQEWTSGVSRVPLSSVDPDLRQIGYRAAKALDALMNGQPPGPAQWIAPLGVVKRRSTEISLQEDPLVAAALSFIRANFARDIATEDMLAELGVSRTTLEKRLKRATGLTPHAALSRERVEQAKKLLLNTRASMGDISQACGFREQPQCNRVFKRLTGMTPGEFRQKQ